MNLKVLVIIILLSLCFFFGLKNISHFKNEAKNAAIGNLKVLKYLPKDNKLLFISNFESSNIPRNIKKVSNTRNLDDLILIKNSILDYLGFDLGKNKLSDIYNNELIISTYENKNKNKDDILIVFKIKPEKNLNDMLNISDEINLSDHIIPIYRENKLNYLNYIYRTKDDYIIASSDKELALNSINSVNNLKDSNHNYSRKIIKNFKNHNNILFSQRIENSLFFDNELSSKNKEDIIATTFSIDYKNLVLKSYLINNKKQLYISSYDDFINNHTKNRDDFQVSIYSDLKNSIKYLNPLINSFEKSLLEELNQKINNNILLLNSGKDWIIAFKDNNPNKINLDEAKKLHDYNKYRLEKDKNIFTIYSKDILEEQENVIKQFTYQDIYSVESAGLLIISNYLIDDENLDLVIEKFFDLNNDNNPQDFLYTKINIKDSNLIKNEYLFYLDELNFLFKNMINIINEEFIEIIKQSIPEKEPILYTENSFKIFK